MRISRERAVEQQAAALRSVSRSGGLLDRSRHILEPASPEIFADFFEDRPKVSAFSEIRVDLSIPFQVVSLADESSKLGKIGWRKRADSIFNFAEAHWGDYTKSRRAEKLKGSRVNRGLSVNWKKRVERLSGERVIGDRSSGIGLGRDGAASLQDDGSFLQPKLLSDRTSEGVPDF